MNPLSISERRRIPVLNRESAAAFDIRDLQREWIDTTATLRKDIIHDPKLRKSFAQLTSLPVNERLPAYALNIYLSHKSIPVPDTLNNYLQLPIVPEDYIYPDLKHAQQFIEATEFEDLVAEIANEYEPNSEEYHEHMQELTEDPILYTGITHEEKQLILTRYQFARDIKLLALFAELIDITPTVTAPTLELPSGTTIQLVDTSATDVLLHPEAWKKRVQLKDRVYRVYIGDQTYILKERKTNRHKDTQRGGHFDGLTSMDECIVAHDMHTHGTVDGRDVSLAWERPIGSVTFPDGFQFAVFEDMPDLTDKSTALRILIGKIIAVSEQFEMQRTELEQLLDLPIDIQTFAKVYAFATTKKGELLFDQTIIEQGYRDRETMGGRGYRVRTKGDIPKMEVVGYDYEYFQHIDATTQQRHLDTIAKRQVSEMSEIGFSTWFDGSTVTETDNVLYRALMQA